MENNTTNLTFKIEYHNPSSSLEAKCYLKSNVTCNIYDPSELNDGMRVLMLESMENNLKTMLHEIALRISCLNDGTYHKRYWLNDEEEGQ